MPEYCLGKVLEVQVDQDGSLRTMVLEVCRKDSHEKLLPYKSKDLKRIVLPVQWMVLITLVANIKEEE